MTSPRPSQLPAHPESCKCPIPAIIVRSRGVAYNVQNAYADWNFGVRRSSERRRQQKENALAAG